MKKESQTKTKKLHNEKKSSILWLTIVAFLAVSLIFFCQFYFGDPISNKSKFYKNTHVNGINISGLTTKEANALLTSSLIDDKEKININLKCQNKEWKLNGEDFSIIGNFENSLDKIMQYGKTGNIFKKNKIKNKIKKDGLNITIPYNQLLGGIENKINNISQEIEKESVEAKIVFNPNEDELFSIQHGTKGIKIDKEKLIDMISNSVINQSQNTIEIPLQEILPNQDLEQMLSNINLISSFSTNYQKSSHQRKLNIIHALENFNGLIVSPGEEISFNNKTGPRTKENGYYSANIIYNGEFISGVGGGVCQASTTLYNALIRANVDILQVNHHSLPVSYVPLSFDAMVSDGYSDLVFKNTHDTPIYIKVSHDENNIKVDIYGYNQDNYSVKTRTSLIKIIPHNGDKIVQDSTGKYANSVLYKGEYLRLKYPHEGYETKGYLQLYKNGELYEEKEIRHDIYQSQTGIIIEGNNDLEEGMTIPDTNIKYISPQKIDKEYFENIKNKINK